MYFNLKNTLKNNRNHTLKQAFSYKKKRKEKKLKVLKIIVMILICEIPVGLNP
jgi:hypothetical protein